MEQMLGNVVEAVLPYVKDEVRFELLLTILHLHMSHCCSEGMIDTVKIETASSSVYLGNQRCYSETSHQCGHCVFNSSS